VEIMHSHAGADGRVLLALLADASVQGVVISATGNGSIHDALHQALL
jgi:L-asparaginase